MDRSWSRRSFVVAALAGGCATPWAHGLPHAVVGADGYASVQAALESAPANPDGPYRILLRPGRWKEKLTISKPWIEIVGEDRERCVLDFDAAAGLTAPDGRPWGTSGSASVTITAADCALRNLTVRNSFDYLGARANPAQNPAGDGLQAVALALAAGADRTIVEDVSMHGYQDTLYVNAGRSLFRGCAIAGAVDYIFGAGTAYFDQCRILTLARPGMVGDKQGIITAPSTLASNPYGLVFDRCRLEKEGALSQGVIALGRPWRPGTRFSDGVYGNPEAVGQAVFLRCWMDDHITSEGWDRMAYRSRSGALTWFEPAEARFFEYRSRGPGASNSANRRLLTGAQAVAFKRERVLSGWAPER